MGRKVDVDDLVDAAAIAERLGVARPQVVHTWRTRYADFPTPVVVLKGSILWLWPEVRSWAKATRRLP